MAADLSSNLKRDAALALHRFGFGPRPGGIAAIASDPRGAILAELDRPGAGRITDVDLLTSGEAARAAFDYRQERKASRLAERVERDQAKAAADAAAKAANDFKSANDVKGSSQPAQSQPAPGQKTADAGPIDAPEKPKPQVGPGIPQQIYLEEAQARVMAALGAEIGFVERLAWFWSNHFCVSADKVRAIAGAFEREAVRPHVTGRFADMLLAVESHPAMLFYLDNAQSIGPKSAAGLNRGKGLNENLAREILELHTLGVRSVYSQDDVTRFANVITGWTIAPPKNDPAHGGEFVFNARMHEPGDQTVVGRAFPDTGVEQGRAVLAMVAHHPATAKHLAEKLARHFVSDQPPPALVDRLAKRFLDTGGNLKEVSRTLVTSPEAWDGAQAKLKKPGEWIVSALRATGVTPPDIRPVMQAQNLLGEPLWRPSAPKGFADDNAAWLDGLPQRLDVANQLARRVAGMVEPDVALEAALGPLASDDTRTAIRRAESRPQALTMLFMAPEFQRR